MKQNYFELFQLPPGFEIERAALDEAWREVQARVHPDRFAAASEREQRLALQWATHANEAYQVLKDPARRAAYLCELNGVALEAESNTAMPPAFLMQQMEWREALEDARRAQDEAALDVLQDELRQAHTRQMGQVKDALQAQDYAQAAAALRRLMFIDKFAAELETAYDLLYL
ncbi:Fe-S protein assembly co-chaperone HscB [Massilia sp. W12]|uniref:Fe-S protein assembly co-chaperone HscB n=1 Tax=Massilia sp. W12 TaxID=3126507 RepID=UPI0030D4F6D9